MGKRKNSKKTPHKSHTKRQNENNNTTLIQTTDKKQNQKEENQQNIKREDVNEEPKQDTNIVQQVEKKVTTAEPQIVDGLVKKRNKEIEGLELNTERIRKETRKGWKSPLLKTTTTMYHTPNTPLTPRFRALLKNGEYEEEGTDTMSSLQEKCRYLEEKSKLYYSKWKKEQLMRYAAEENVNGMKAIMNTLESKMEEKCSKMRNQLNRQHEAATINRTLALKQKSIPMALYIYFARQRKIRKYFQALRVNAIESKASKMIHQRLIKMKTFYLLKAVKEQEVIKKEKQEAHYKAIDNMVTQINNAKEVITKQRVLIQLLGDRLERVRTNRQDVNIQTEPPIEGEHVEIQTDKLEQLEQEIQTQPPSTITMAAQTEDPAYHGFKIDTNTKSFHQLVQQHRQQLLEQQAEDQKPLPRYFTRLSERQRTIFFERLSKPKESKKVMSKTPVTPTRNLHLDHEQPIKYSTKSHSSYPVSPRQSHSTLSFSKYYEDSSETTFNQSYSPRKSSSLRSTSTKRSFKRPSSAKRTLSTKSKRSPSKKKTPTKKRTPSKKRTTPNKTPTLSPRRTLKKSSTRLKSVVSPTTELRHRVTNLSKQVQRWKSIADAYESEVVTPKKHKPAKIPQVISVNLEREASPDSVMELLDVFDDDASDISDMF